MPKQSVATPLTGIEIDPSLPVPLYRQLYRAIREAILDGRLTPGFRLPSTRNMADQLGISRNTVLNTFEQLLAEGYLEGKVGDGTYVARMIPDEVLRPRTNNGAIPRMAGAKRELSARGKHLSTIQASAARDGRARAFRPGIPALDQFPFDAWGRIAARWWRCPPQSILTYGDAAGYRPLREEIAVYLRTMRAVRCEPEQIIIVAGSQQALDLTARVLIDPGDSVWLENPGYMGARGAMLSAGANLIPVPVDDEGLNVDAGIEYGGIVRLAYVSPSHQYPLGVTMSLKRRLALLEWASQHGAWILEDDYDSEYRYASRPLAALQGLDRDNRVIYIGTFSKVLFPALRLGYLVVPPDLVDVFMAARALIDRHSPSVEQAIVADFMAEGHFIRHIRRMRALYAERQQILIDSAAQFLTGLLDVRPAEAGMHVMGWLPAGIDDRAASREASKHNVDVPPLSAYTLGSPARSGGLLLGYAAIAENEIRAGVQRLARVLSQI